MRIGDHLISPRLGYVHHGLYLGNSKVIHYSGFADGWNSGTISITSLGDFANGHEIEVSEHLFRTYDREESIERAYKRLGEDWYNLLLNNCEHFVYWCITGCHLSLQVQGVTLNAATLMNAEKIMTAARKILAKEIVLDGLAIPQTAGALNALSAFTPAASQMTAVTTRAATQAINSVVSSNLVTATATTAGLSTAATLTGTGTVVVGLAASTLSTVALPVLAVGALGYGIKKIWDNW